MTNLKCFLNFIIWCEIYFQLFHLFQGIQEFKNQQKYEMKRKVVLDISKNISFVMKRPRSGSGYICCQEGWFQILALNIRIQNTGKQHSWAQNC